MTTTELKSFRRTPCVAPTLHSFWLAPQMIRIMPAIRAEVSRRSTSGPQYQSSRRREIRDRFLHGAAFVLIVGPVIAVCTSAGNGIEHRTKNPARESVEYLELRRRKLAVGLRWPENDEHAAGGRAQCVGVYSGGERRRVDDDDVELQAHGMDETIHQLRGQELG